MFDDYRKFVSEYGLEVVEVSDGSMYMPHDEKLNYIRILAKEYQVLSEVGSKVAGVVIPRKAWIMMMKSELDAGSIKVIAEARESGNIGIYNSDGSANIGLVNNIIESIDINKILWEAPNKKQQVWFVKQLGANVNLGNIAVDEVISLETIRLGLRGDTFYDYLPNELKSTKQEG